MTSVCGMICPMNKLCCSCLGRRKDPSCCGCGGVRWLAESCDSHRNIDRIGEVTVPIFIMHSKDDEVVSFEHTEILIEAAVVKPTVWWMSKPDCVRNADFKYRHASVPSFPVTRESERRMDPEFEKIFADFLQDVLDQYKKSHGSPRGPSKVLEGADGGVEEGATDPARITLHMDSQDLAVPVTTSEARTPSVVAEGTETTSSSTTTTTEQAGEASEGTVEMHDVEHSALDAQLAALEEEVGAGACEDHASSESPPGEETALLPSSSRN